MTRLKCRACHAKWWWRSPKSKVLRLPRQIQLIFWKPCKGIAPVTQNDCRHFIRHVTMSRSATPAKNGIWHHMTSFETFSTWKHLPHRHGDTTRKSENRDETYWSGSPKRAFSYTFINVLHEPQNSLPQNRCFVRGFRQFSSNHMLQSANPAIRFARCHHLTHPWQCYSHKEDAPRVQSPAPATKNFWKPGEHIALVTSWKHVAMSQCHACHTKRGCATFETFKSD
jgi:hypothetical protein